MIPSYSKEEHLKADSPPTEAGDRPSPQHIMVFGRWGLPLNGGKGVSGSGDSSGGVASGISKGSGEIVNPKQSQKSSTPPLTRVLGTGGTTSITDLVSRLNDMSPEERQQALQNKSLAQAIKGFGYQINDDGSAVQIPKKQTQTKGQTKTKGQPVMGKGSVTTSMPQVRMMPTQPLQSQKQVSTSEQIQQIRRMADYQP